MNAPAESQRRTTPTRTTGRWGPLGWPAWINVLLALGILLRVREYLAGRSLWLDESFLALEVIEKSPRELLGPLGFNQGAPPGFLLGQDAVAEVAGYSELALRFLPFLFGVLALFAFVPLARRTVSPSAVPIALVLVVVADGLVYYSAEAKQYSIDVFAAVFVLAVAVPFARSTPLRRRDVMLALVATPLIFLSHAAIFVAAGCGAVIVARAVVRRSRDQVLRAVPFVATWAIACLAVVVSAPDYSELRGAQESRTFVGQDGGVVDPSWIVGLGGDLALGLGLPGAGQLALVAKILAGVAALGLVSLSRRDPVAAALIVTPLAVALAASALELYPIHVRTVLFFVPGLSLLLGEGALAIASLMPRANRGVVFGAASVLVLALPVAKAVDRFVERPARQELRPALAYVRDHWRPGDTLYVGWGDQYAYLYYLRCACFDLDTSTGTRLPSRVIRLDGIAAQDYAAFRSSTPSLVVSRYSAWDVDGRLDDLDALRGRGRVWVVSAHTWPGDPTRYREELVPRRLDRLGRRLDVYAGRGGRAYLYDLRRRS